MTLNNGSGGSAANGSGGSIPSSGSIGCDRGSNAGVDSAQERVDCAATPKEVGTNPTCNTLGMVQGDGAGVVVEGDVPGALQAGAAEAVRADIMRALRVSLPIDPDRRTVLYISTVGVYEFLDIKAPPGLGQQARCSSLSSSQQPP